MEHKKLITIFLFSFFLIPSIATANELVDIEFRDGHNIVIDINPLIDPENITEPWHLREYYNLSFIFSLNPYYQEPTFELFDEDTECWGGASIIFSPPRLAFGMFTVEIYVSNTTVQDVGRVSGYFLGRWTRFHYNIK